MNMRQILRPVVLGFALALAAAPAARAAGETCSPESFGDAVDASAAELRQFSAETQPKLKEKLLALRDHKQWTEPDFESKGLALVHDAKLDEFDAKAGDLLSKIDTLGSPETSDPNANTSCANLAELKTASSELMSVMRAKSAYLIARVDREIATTPAAVKTAEVAQAETAPAGPAGERPAAKPSDAASTTVKPAGRFGADGSGSYSGDMTPANEAALSPLRSSPDAAKKADEPKQNATPAEPPKGPDTSAAAPAPKFDSAPKSESSPKAETAPRAEPQAAPPAVKPEPKSDELKSAEPKSETTSSWSTTTAQAVIPPPPMYQRAPSGTPNYDAPPPGDPYSLPPANEDGTALTDPALGPDDGYTIDEIREATRGFFGTVSTSLASVIEHAFQKGGRPTAYVLGNEGGGAFLAGLRYGEGTLYLRSGGTQKVYWHGPSIGYDVGAEGSRTLFLIYSLDDPANLFRRYTGVDGSAYLVGGVGMTLLKGGPVMMAPIRSGIGLRLGASIGYVRFTSRPTWNPF
jgi:hypothetical protein